MKAQYKDPTRNTLGLSRPKRVDDTWQKKHSSLDKRILASNSNSRLKPRRLISKLESMTWQVKYEQMPENSRIIVKTNLNPARREAHEAGPTPVLQEYIDFKVVIHYVLFS